MSDVVSSKTISWLSRKLRHDTVLFLAREYLNVSEADLRDLTTGRSAEDANFDILTKWRQQEAGTVTDLRGILEQARKEGVAIDVTLADTFAFTAQQNSSSHNGPICRILLVCPPWDGGEFEVTVVTRLLLEHFYLVDPQRKTFKIYCFLFEPDDILKTGHKVYEELKALNVLTFGYRIPIGLNRDPTRQELNVYTGAFYGHCRYKIDDQIDLVLGHFPSTHLGVLNAQQQMYPDAKTASMVHVCGALFRQELEFMMDMDLVFSIGQHTTRSCKSELAGQANRVVQYVPSCPTEVIRKGLLKDQESVLGQPSVTFLTYLSDLYENPLERYNLEQIITSIAATKTGEWKLLATGELAREQLSEHFNSHKFVSIINTQYEQEVKGHFLNANYLVCPAEKDALNEIFPLELLFAVGAATPIITEMKRADVLMALSELMTKPQAGIASLGNISQDDGLHQLAKTCLLSYILDTKAASTDRHLLQCILGACVPSAGKTVQMRISITGENARSITQDLTRMMKRIFYLKGWLDDDTLQLYMPGLKKYQGPLEEALGIPEGNIILRVVHESCKLLVYCPTDGSHGVLVQNKERVVQIIQGIIGAKTSRSDLNVDIILEDSKLSDGALSDEAWSEDMEIGGSVTPMATPMATPMTIEPSFASMWPKSPIHKEDVTDHNTPIVNGTASESWPGQAKTLVEFGDDSSPPQAVSSPQELWPGQARTQAEFGDDSSQSLDASSSMEPWPGYADSFAEFGDSPASLQTQTSLVESCTAYSPSQTDFDSSISSLQSVPSYEPPSPLRSGEETDSASPASSSPGGTPKVTIPDWHYSKDVLRELQIFHQHKAGEPGGMPEARETHAKYVTRMIERLKGSSQLKVNQPKFTGSAYEGVKIGTVIEFDVMIILNGKDIEEVAIPDQPGYALLKPTKGKETSEQFKGLLDKEGYISAQNLSRKFYGEIQRVINDTPEFKKNISLKAHGTVATQMNVSRGDGEVWYEVDMVPCFEIPAVSDGGKAGAKEDHRYVAKPQNDPTSKGLATSVWRRSFSMEEMKAIKGIDPNSGCRKQCLRVLKTIREKESTFKILTSYLLKTLLLHENQEPDLTWNADDLLVRVMGLLTKLKQALDDKYLANFFVPEVNLLKDIAPSTAKNIKDRITVLTTKEPKFMKLIKS